MTSLTHQPVLILDCQTTGMTPAHGHLLELGWAVARAGEGAVRPTATLVRQPEGGGVPRRIRQLTGIEEAEVEGAPAKAEVWGQLTGSLDPGDEALPWVIHYARFERPFLEDLAGEGAAPRACLCTYEIGRRLLPGLPSRSIRGMAGYLGHPIGELKRAGHHVEATFFIWRELVRRLEQEQGVTTLEALQKWLRETKPAGKGRKTFALPSAVRLALPDAPGVYRMKSHSGSILYVGKATSLKNRVNSYFRGRKTKGSRLNELITQIADIEYDVVGSPLEAAIRESDAIKRWNPPYNRALKRGERQVGYCDRSLRPAPPEAGGVWGPFVARGWLDELDLVFAAAEDPGRAVALAGEEIPVELVRSATELFESWYGLPLSRDTRVLRSLLARMFARRVERIREQLRARAEPEEMPEEEEDEAPEELPQWTPELLAGRMAGVLGATAMRIFQGRWLVRLCHCRVFWRGAGETGWREAAVYEGRIGFPGTSFGPDTERRNPRGDFSRVRASLTLETYDRLNVLRTELLKVLRAGGEVELAFSGGARLTSAQVKERLFPGHFDY